MNKVITIIISLLLLSACQEDQNKTTEQAETAVETTQQKQPTENQAAKDQQQESHEHHDHSASSDGSKYQTIEPQVTCEKPIVIEFFAYQCPHCYNLEPSAEAWRKKNAGKVEFRSIPTTLGHEELGSLLLVHHAAKLLGIGEKTQHALFNRFHKEKKLFASQEEAVEFLVAQGADAKKAATVLSDKEGMSKSIEADFELLKQYKISSVPFLLVNHQYTTSIDSAGGHTEVFEVVDETLQLTHSCQAK